MLAVGGRQLAHSNDGDESSHCGRGADYTKELGRLAADTIISAWVGPAGWKNARAQIAGHQRRGRR